jgi:hypothetical protein
LLSLAQIAQKYFPARRMKPNSNVPTNFFCPELPEGNHLLFAASVEETGPGEDPRRKMDAAKGALEACGRLMWTPVFG